MRILQVSHDRWPEVITGVSVYCHALEKEMVRRGHHVYHLYSRPRDWRLHPYLRWDKRDGIAYGAIVNSPISWHFSIDRPLQDCKEERIERLFSRCLEETAPDVVHFHGLQGFPASLLSLTRKSRIKIVVTLNDYFMICPRLFLLRRDLSSCDGPEGGINCLTFCCTQASFAQRSYRRLMVTLPEGSLKKVLSYVRDASRGGRRPSQRVMPNVAGIIDHEKLRDHSVRERFLKSALLEADAIIAPSNSVKAQFVTHGIPPERIDLIPYGVMGGEAIKRRSRRFRNYPITFGFLGSFGPIKGTDLLVEAARTIQPDKARFLLYGQGAQADIDHLRSLASNAPHIHFMGPYARERLPEILETFDVLIFPSIVAETGGNVGLEGQTAGLPIVGSRIGAIPDYVHDGYNGLLFEPRSAEDLRKKIERIIQEPSLIKQLSDNVVPPASMKDHVTKLLELYTKTPCRNTEEFDIQMTSRSESASKS